MLSPEEQELINAIQKYQKARKKSIVRLLVDNILNYACDLVTQKGPLFHQDTLEFLSQITQHHDIHAWKYLQEHDFFCYECGTELLTKECGLLLCSNIHCRAVNFVETNATKAQCPYCISYRQKDCSGVYNRGNVVTKPKKEEKDKL